MHDIVSIGVVGSRPTAPPNTRPAATKEGHYRELALEFACFIFLHLALSPALLMPASRQLTDFLLMGTLDLAYFNKVDKT
ncbi:MULTISPECIES: hypothetical protein [Aeromonas]|uniref:hypothetical protein n=1 Tax=Aeromonas TaxID=642 RepID=UPI0013A6C239|nr:hypothetical protein [Aeromonas media]